MSSEYSQPSSGYSPCSYATLCAYNSGGQMAPMPSNARNVSGSYIVPSYSAPGYDTLSRSGSCAGYYNINSAYGQNSGTCNQQYLSSLCGGCNYKK